MIAKRRTRAPCPGGHAAETRGGAEFLVALQVDVIDARFAGFYTIHYLRKGRICDLQTITDQ